MYVAREIWKITFLFEHSSYIEQYMKDFQHSLLPLLDGPSGPWIKRASSESGFIFSK